MIKSVNAVEAVADQVGCDPDDLTLETHTHYGLEVFSNGRNEYAVGRIKKLMRLARNISRIPLGLFAQVLSAIIATYPKS